MSSESSVDLLSARRILVSPGNVRCNVGGCFHFAGNLVQGGAAPIVISDGSMVAVRPVGASAAAAGSQADLLAWWLMIVGGHVVNNANPKTVQVSLNQQDQVVGTVLFTLPITVNTGNFWSIQCLLAFGGAGVVRIAGHALQGPGTPTFVLPAVGVVNLTDSALGIALAVNASVGGVGDVILDQRVDLGGGAGGIVAGQPDT